MTPTQPDALVPASVVLFRDLPPHPWRNGGGITRDLAVRSDAQGLAWRISIAEVASAGEFSAFPGMDRLLMLCRGTGMHVTVDNTEHLLGPWDTIRFPGDAATRATLVDGPTTDLNVMTRRGSARAAVAVTVLDGTVPAWTPQSPEVATTCVVVLDGHLRCRGANVVDTRLRPFDSIHLTASSEPIDIVGSGRVVRIDVNLL